MGYPILLFISNSLYFPGKNRIIEFLLGRLKNPAPGFPTNDHCPTCYDT